MLDATFVHDRDLMPEMARALLHSSVRAPLVSRMLRVTDASMTQSLSSNREQICTKAVADGRVVMFIRLSSHHLARRRPLSLSTMPSSNLDAQNASGLSANQTRSLGERNAGPREDRILRGIKEVDLLSIRDEMRN